MGLFDFLRATPLAFCCVSVVIPFVALSIGANCLLNLSQKACTKLNLTNCASACGTGLIHTKRFMRSVGSHFCASTSQIFFPYEYAIYVKNGDSNSIANNQNFINELKQKMKTLNNNHNIVISNHILYTDWLYVWIFLLSVIDDPSSAVFIMKDSLQHVPVAGTVMRFLGYLFLKREAEKDLPYLSEKVGNNKEKSVNYVIFPEGTTYDSNTIQESDKHSENLGKQLFNHVLHPKHKGVFEILQNQSINGILDLTFCFEDLRFINSSTKKPVEHYYTIGSLLLGRYPKQVATMAKYYEKKDIPHKNDNEIKEWIYDRFTEKEAFIEDIHVTKHEPYNFSKICTVKPTSKYANFFKLYYLMAGTGATYAGWMLIKSVSSWF